MKFSVYSLRWLLFLLLGCLLTATALAADDLSLVWQNKFSEAKIAYQATLRRAPTDASALMGMATITTLEDSAQEAVGYWQRYVQAAPDGWETMASWTTLVEMAQGTGQWDELDHAARTILAVPNAAAQMRASARLVLAQSAQRHQQHAAAEAIWSQFGYVRKWMVIGPFDNISNSGYAKAFPPEAGLDFTKGYPGLDNMPLRWYPLGLVARNGVCRIGEALGGESEAVYYAATAVNSSTRQQVFISLDADGAFQLFLNGQCVLVNDICGKSAEFVADTYHVAITLQAGWNTVLLKLATRKDVDTSATYRLRFTDQHGNALAGLTTDTTRVAPGAATKPPAPLKAEYFVMTAMRDLPDSVEVAYNRASCLSDIGDNDAAITVLRGALTLQPHSALLHAMLSKILHDDHLNDDSQAELDLARAESKGIVAAEVTYLEEHRDAIESAELIKLLTQLRATFPNSAQLAWALCEAYMKANMEADQFAIARIAVHLSPGPEYIGRLVDMLNFSSRQDDANVSLQFGLQTNPDSTELLQDRATMLAQKGKIADAIAIYQQMLKVATTIDPELWVNMAKDYHALKQFTPASDSLRILCSLCPQHAEYYTQLGDMLRDMGKKPEAVAQYQLAISFDPSRTELRERVQILTGEQPVIAMAPATPSEDLLAAAAKMKDGKGESAYVFLDEARQVVYPDFSTDSRSHLIVKVFDESAVKRLHSFYAKNVTRRSKDTIEKAIVIKADGKKEDVTDSAEGAHVAFPSLAVGDTLDITYRVQDTNSGALSKHFWTLWMFSYDDYPVGKSRYALITPASMSYQPRAHGTIPVATVKKVGDWTMSEWVQHDITGKRSEGDEPASRDTGNWIDISTVPSWADIVRWYRDIADPLCKPDETVRAKALELTHDVTGESEKIRVLVKYVANDIQYQSTPFRMSAFTPTEGKQVLREKYGDCKDKSALLTALLSAVDIKANMVLLSTRSSGVTPLLPSPRFDHAITCVHTAGGPQWIDPTAEQMAFGCLPVGDQGVPALLIDAATTDLTTSPILPADKVVTAVQYKMALSADGKLTGDITLALAGNVGWMARNEFQEIADADSEKVLRGFLPLMLSNAKYDRGAILDKADMDKPMTLAFNCHADNYCTTAGDFLFFHLPWPSKSLLGYDDAEDHNRTQDMENSDGAGIITISSQMQFPAGYALQDTLKPLDITLPYGTGRLTYRVEGNTLYADLRTTITVLRIPVADWPQRLAAQDALEKEMNRQFVFKKQ